jgi:hypothetical protein
MKKFTNIITVLKTILKYSAFIFAIVEVLQFAIKTFENINLEQETKK